MQKYYRVWGEGASKGGRADEGGQEVRAKRSDVRMQMHENARVKPVTLDANMDRNEKSKCNWDVIQKGRLLGVLERNLTAQRAAQLSKEEACYLLLVLRAV